MARANPRIRWILGHRFLARLQGSGQILRRTVRVHDHHARTPVFFFSEVPQLFKGENRRLIILDLTIELPELLIQNGE